MHPLVRVLAALTIASGAAVAGLFFAFVGFIHHTGCFLSCSAPDPIGAAMTFTLAALCAGLGLGSLSVALFGSRFALWRTFLVGLGSTALLIVLGVGWSS